LERKAYPDLLSIPKTIKIDVVDIFRRPEEVLSLLREALKEEELQKFGCRKELVVRSRRFCK